VGSIEVSSDKPRKKLKKCILKRQLKRTTQTDAEMVRENSKLRERRGPGGRYTERISTRGALEGDSRDWGLGP